MIGESHSGDMATLWRGGKRFLRSRAFSAFGNYSPPTRFNCLSEQGVGGLEGCIRPTCFAASTLSFWVLRGRRGAWTLCIYIKYA